MPRKKSHSLTCPVCGTIKMVRQINFSSRGYIRKCCSHKCAGKLLSEKYLKEGSPSSGLHHTPEVLARIGKASKLLWSDPEFRERVRLSQVRARQLSPNIKESKLESILDFHFPSEWKFTGGGSVMIGGFCPDFMNCNGKKAVIELFGSYWHGSRKGVKYHQTEEGRKEVYKGFGFDCLVIWEHELRDEEEVIFKIREFSCYG